MKTSKLLWGFLKQHFWKEEVQEGFLHQMFSFHWAFPFCYLIKYLI